MLKIFTYGTLQRGMYNNGVIPKCAIYDVEPAVARGNLFIVKSTTFPAMVIPSLKKDIYEIKGEIIYVKDEFALEVLNECDILEGHPLFYKRRKIEVKTLNNEKHLAYVYVMLHEKYLGEEITDGDYKSFYNNHIKKVKNYKK